MWPVDTGWFCPRFRQLLLQFAAFLAHILDDEDGQIVREHVLQTPCISVKLLMDKNVAYAIPNIKIMLPMYLVLTVTNCYEGPSFNSQFKEQTTYYSTMYHNALSQLAFIRTECERLTSTIIIQDFTRPDSCKVPGRVLSYISWLIYLTHGKYIFEVGCYGIFSFSEFYLDRPTLWMAVTRRKIQTKPNEPGNFFEDWPSLIDMQKDIT